MRTYRFPDLMAHLPDGPWKSEPDKVQWVDPDTDLDCLIVRNPMGVLCGYVGVPPAHPWYECDRHDIPPVNVHGGVNFSDSCQEGDEDGPVICHVPEPGRPTTVWWFGFDTGHAWDVIPLVSEMVQFPGAYYRDLGYVQEQIRQLAAQLYRAGCSTSNR